MDREIYYFEESSCYVVRWTRDITTDRLLQHWESLVRDPLFEPGFAALHDARGREMKADQHSIKEGAYAYRSKVEPQVGFARLAILLDDPAEADHARKILALLELEDTIITHSEAEAKQWVGLPADLSLPYDV